MFPSGDITDNAAGIIVRLAALLFFALWGMGLIAADIRTGEIAASFIHLTILPLHEAGHLIFRPLGEFMSIIGGSLLQVLLPLSICATFVFKNRDAYAAALSLWWAGASFLDIAPYIYDALDPQLMLISGRTGAEDGGHDWINIFSRIGYIQEAHNIARFTWFIGSVMICVAMIWGAVTLLRAWRERTT